MAISNLEHLSFLAPDNGAGNPDNAIPTKVNGGIRFAATASSFASGRFFAGTTANTFTVVVALR